MVRDKVEGERKMESAVIKLENVLKVMTRKVISLEEELVNVKDNMKHFENKTREGNGPEEIVNDEVNDFKDDISNKGFNPKSASSPKDKN